MISKCQDIAIVIIFLKGEKKLKRASVSHERTSSGLESSKVDGGGQRKFIYKKISKPNDPQSQER